jgi:sporulation protein YlmC with PRC-barrel domain
MIQTYSQIVGTFVIREEDGQIIALINDIIINPDTGKIEAFWVKPVTMPFSNAIIKSESIIKWGKKIHIQGEGDIAEAEDVIKISEILAQNIYFIGNIVKNEAGATLGKVYDLDFDTEKLYLRQIYSEKRFLIFSYNQRIFSYNAILKATPDHILVKDVEEKKVKVGQEVLSAT